MRPSPRFCSRNGPPRGLAAWYFVVCQGAWFVAVYGGACANVVPEVRRVVSEGVAFLSLNLDVDIAGVFWAAGR